MSEPIDTCVRRADFLFGKRYPLLSFWQEIAESFHPLRGQFTRQFYMSEQFADRIMTSYPMLVQRELKNTFTAMLRPRDQEWFQATVEGMDKLDRDSKIWLEWASGVMRRAMYDRVSQFARATKEGDGDFAAFGQCVITTEIDMSKAALLYRCWHLKDTIWAEDYDGTIGEVYRKWRPTVADLCKLFPKTVSPVVKGKLDKQPHEEVECMHVVLQGDDYDRIKAPEDKGAAKTRTPWAVLTLDVANKCVLQECGSHRRIYTLPRWETVSGSAFAYSPAAVAGLPDARVLQAMTLTLLEAGEMSVRPPLVATKEAVRSDVSIYSGGVTWVDAEYDERLGEALRPLITVEGAGIQQGMELIKDAREMLSQAFFLNKLALPPPGREMTAYETGQRIQEWIRQALPLFEPVEVEYNGQLCDDTFNALMRVNAFGPPNTFPRALRGREVKFDFESPLHQATKRKNAAIFLQVGQMLTQAAQLDPTAPYNVDATTALRDALEAIETPETWITDLDQVNKMKAAKQQQDQATLRTQQVSQAAQAVQSLGGAAQQIGGSQAGA